MSSGFQFCDDNFGGFFRLDAGTAGKNIRAGVAVLRPGMNAQVRLRDENNTADTLRTELVKWFSENRRAGLIGSGEHNISNKTDVIEKLRVAVI